MKKPGFYEKAGFLYIFCKYNTDKNIMITLIDLRLVIPKK